MKIVILTEGNRTIGFGHITRCLSICQAFEEKGVNPSFIVNGDENVGVLLQGKSFAVFDWTMDAARLSSSLKIADAVLIDSLLITDELLGVVYDNVRNIVYIDDFKRREHGKGIVIDWTVLADQIEYHKKKAGIKYLTGSGYTALRKEFWDENNYAVKEKVKSILLTFGGGDLRNLAPRSLEMLNKTYPGLRKNVIIGRGFSNVKEIEAVADEKTSLIYYPDAQGMKAAMLGSDIAISAGGQTLYELARMGVPTIAVTLIDNQIYDVSGWEKTGFLENAGWWNDKGLFDRMSELIAKYLNFDVRLRKNAIAKSHIDGSGARKIAGNIIDYVNTSAAGVK